MTEIKFYRTRMREMILINKIRQNSSLMQVIKSRKDVTEEMTEDINHRLEGSINNFVTIFIKGEQGTQKSSAGISLAQKFDPTFNIERINFTYDEFTDKFKNSMPKTFHQLDEEVFKYGTGSQRVVNEMQTLIETLRKRQNSMIVVSPELKYFPEELFTYVLETFDNAIIVTCPRNKKPHETRLCLCDKEHNYEVKEAYVRTVVKKEGQYLGFYILKIEWNTPLWQEYSRRKDDFNEKVKDQTHIKTDFEKMADKILNDPEAEDYRNNRQLKLLIYKKHPNITTAEAEMIIQAIKIKRRNI